MEEKLPEGSSVIDEESEIHREMFGHLPAPKTQQKGNVKPTVCLLYTSDAADDLLCVDLGGRRIIKK